MLVSRIVKRKIVVRELVTELPLAPSSINHSEFIYSVNRPFTVTEL